MRRGLSGALCGCLAMAGAFLLAQGGSPVVESLPSGITAPAPTPPAGAPPDTTAVARGTVLYEPTLNCAACHGLTGRGGTTNSPDLTKSALAMAPDGGRGLAASCAWGAPTRACPRHRRC